MANPNPFLFGSEPQADMANPFMQAAGGMADPNPFMAQQQMMGQQPAFNQFGQMGHADAANPFGGMGYQAQGMMGYGYQAAHNSNPYGNAFDQYGSMAHMNTNTSSVPSSAYHAPAASQPSSLSGAALFGVETSVPSSSAAQPAVGAQQQNVGETLFGVETPTNATAVSASAGKNVGAALFGEEPTPATMITSPPAADVNPFLASQEPAVSSADPTMAANPFADDSQDLSIQSKGELEDATKPAATAESQLPQLSTEDGKEQRPQTLVTEMVGGLEVSTSDMLQKLEIAKTPVIQEDVVKDEPTPPSDTDSDSDSDSSAPKVATQMKGDTAADTDAESEVEEIAKAPAIVIEKESTEPKGDTGFSGIFSSELDVTADTIQTATSHVDLNSETDLVNTNATENDTKADENSQPKEKINSDSDEPPSYYDATEPEKPAVLSTGDAIFADLPAVPNIKSTGAAIFGLSDESAAGTTGAALFDIVAPEQDKPYHGQMTGWDENFDKKFERAEMDAVSSRPMDAFGGFGTNTGAAAFGYGAPPPAFGDEPSFGDSFGMLPVTADLNNPFLAEKSGFPGPGEKSGEDAETPLFDSDVSKPLQVFPRLDYESEGWDMYIRHPPKKKITAQRFWKKVHVRIVNQGDNPAILLFDSKEAKEPFQELPLQAAYSLSDISHQIFDQYSKVFTIKLQYIFYKERAGIRPGQVSKMQKLTDKIGFLAKAVEDADYQGVKEFASDMKKLGVPLEHAPQISELLKLASYSYEDMKQFSVCIEERLFKLDVHRDRALTYKTEEVQMTAVDEVYVEQDADGHILQHLCRVRVFFLSFLSGNMGNPQFKNAFLEA